MKLILVRHGETEENIKRIQQGWLPGKLTRKGKEQGKKVALKLKNKKIDIIYTSDLTRCVETAMEIKKYHKNAKLIKDKALRERGKGVFEGKRKDEINWTKLKGDIYTNKPKGGESFKDVLKRIKKFYSRLKKYKDETIVVVGHGGSLLILKGLIFNKDLKTSLEDKKLSNVGIFEVKVKRG